MGSTDGPECAELSLERASSDSPSLASFPHPSPTPPAPSSPACLLSGCRSAPLSLWLLVCKMGRHPLVLGINPDPGGSLWRSASGPWWGPLSLWDERVGGLSGGCGPCSNLTHTHTHTLTHSHTVLHLPVCGGRGVRSLPPHRRGGPLSAGRFG